METLLFLTLAIVETNNNPKAVGDGGRSIGIYQISRAYWQDSKIPGRWEDCFEPSYAKRVVEGYFKRYAPAAFRAAKDGNITAVYYFALIHNGGPKGYKKKAAHKYARRFILMYRRVGNTCKQNK